MTTTSDRPLIADSKHPIETGRYLLATAEIERMYNAVSTWLENRSPGGIIHGRPRIGKTRSINYLKVLLADSKWRNIPIFSFEARKYKMPTEVRFFEDLLRGVGHGLILSGSPSAKRDRLLSFLLEQTKIAGLNRLIFIIDDAQNFQAIQYSWLMDVYNELDSEGVSMTVILVGQDDLISQRSAFLLAKAVQIVGRFMVHTFHFRGILTLEDLEICLSRYDDYSEYPPGSGWSFTQYYYPEEYADGFRLKNFASGILEVFMDLRKEKGMKIECEIPMQYITLMVEYILKHFGINSEAYTSQLGSNHWREAIERSGYIDAEIYQEVAS